MTSKATAAIRAFVPRVSLANPVALVVFVAVAAAVLVPLGFLVLGSFSLAPLPTDLDLAELSFENYEEVWREDGTARIFLNTVIYVAGATAFGSAVAVALAWLVERTDMPGKIWIYAGVPMTLAVPSMLQAMAWVLLLSPRIGFLNSFLQGVLGIGPLNIYSLG
ncbi:MAG: hypothetical protein RL477_1560, partial [Pseudomonadota bacterium]